MTASKPILRVRYLRKLRSNASLCNALAPLKSGKCWTLPPEYLEIPAEIKAFFLFFIIISLQKYINYYSIFSYLHKEARSAYCEFSKKRSTAICCPEQSSANLL